MLNLEKIKDLELLALKLANQDMKQTSERTIKVHALFEKGTSIFSSLTMLINSYLDNRADHSYLFYDVTTLASISRNFIDIARTLNYIDEKGMNSDERELRFSILSFHKKSEELRIMKMINNHQEIELNHFSELEKKYTDNRLAKSLKKSEISEKESKKIKKGKKSIMTERIIRRDLPLSYTEEKVAYDILSQNIHSLDLGVHQHQFGENIFSYIPIIKLCLNLSLIYFAFIIKEFLKVRRSYYRYLSNLEINFIESCLDTSRIQEIYEEKLKKYSEKNYNTK